MTQSELMHNALIALDAIINSKDDPDMIRESLEELQAVIDTLLDTIEE